MQNGTAAARSGAEASTSSSSAGPAAPQAGQVTVSYSYRWVLVLMSVTMYGTPDGSCGDMTLTLGQVHWLMRLKCTSC